MNNEFPDSLSTAIKGTYEGFQTRLIEVPYEWKCDKTNVSGKFFYLSFRDGTPSVSEFAEYVYHRIIPYCLPRAIRAEKDEKYSQTHDVRFIHELTDQARNLFISAKKSQKTSGEPGEVILFMLLEAIIRAPQIACKMFLKTSENMPVHGSDSIHLTMGDTKGSVRLIWGESKLYGELSDALDAVCGSLRDFLDDKSGRSSRDRDIDIIRDYMDVSEQLKPLLLKYFDPYEPQSNLREEAFACLVGFDYTTYQKLEGSSAEEKESHFQREYSARIHSACELFCEKLKKTGLDKLRIYFFLIPFPDLLDFRSQFFQRLGIS